MEHRDFDAEPTEDRSSTFTLGGETFTTLSDLPAQAYKALRGDLAGADRAADFIVRCLIAEDRQRWKDLMDDDDRLVPASKLGDAFNWITTRYTERPTKPPTA